MNMNSNETIQNKFKKILTVKNHDEKIELTTTMIHLNIMNEIANLMEIKSINKTELAEKLNVSKSYITQLFTADKIINLKLIAQIQDIFNIKFGITLFGEFMAIVPEDKQNLISDLATKENSSTIALTQSILNQGITLKTLKNVTSIATNITTGTSYMSGEYKDYLNDLQPIKPFTATQVNFPDQKTA